MIIIINIIISSSSWFFDGLDWTDRCTSLSLSLSNYTSTTTITLYSIETHTSVTLSVTTQQLSTEYYHSRSDLAHCWTLLQGVSPIAVW